MNTTELAEVLGNTTTDSSTKAGRKHLVETVFDIIASELKDGNEVNIPGFGKFKVKDMPARQGRNPQTGAVVEIAASKKAAFSASKALKDKLN